MNFSRTGAVYVDKSAEQLVYIGEYFGGIGTNLTGERIGPRVTVMDRSGEVLARLGDQTMGPEDGRFYSPHGLAVDSRGDIYVADVTKSEDYGGLLDNSGEMRSLQKLVRI